MAAEEQARQHPPKRPRLCFSDSVEVLVGRDKTPFSVHKHILCSRSTFFEAAFSQRWRTGSKAVELSQDDPVIFDIYLHCVYKGSVNPGNLDEIRPEEQGVKEDTDAVKNGRSVEAYLLADKLGDVITANMIINYIIDQSDEADELPGAFAASIVSQRTHTSSLLRRLFIDYYVHESNEMGTKILCENDRVTRGFICEILQEKQRVGDEDRERRIDETFRAYYARRNKCRYHQHDKANPCCGAECKEQRSC